LSDRVDLGQFMSGFLLEASEHLGLANRNLLTIENDLRQGRPSPRAIRDLYRSLHTIKGLAAMVGVEPIVEITHAMETVVRAGDRRGGRLPEAALDVLLQGISSIEHRVAALSSGAEIQPAPPALIEALADLGPLAAPRPAPEVSLSLPAEIADRLSESERIQLAGQDDGRRAVRLQFTPSPARAAQGLTITSVRERLSAVAEIVKVVPLSRPPQQDTPGGLVFVILLLTAAPDQQLSEAAGGTGELHLVRDARAAAPAPEPAEIPEESLVEESVASRGVVRVEVSRLDDALEKLSSLVVTRYRLARAVADLGARGADVRALWQIVQENGKQLRDLRGSITRARMISVAEMLERVPLLVRGLARSSGKAISLDLDTGKAELDKAVAERVFPAIIHLVRNAVDHGIESPTDRTAAGKPTQSTLRVTCFERSSNQLELTIEDDGRGIDAAALARRAGREVPATDEALLGLITLPGLSTHEAATTTSGRGMGMNIVKRALDDLGGELSVRTARGRGTTFVLRIPLSITIVDAFSFRCGQQPFVVPVTGVEEIIEVDPADVTRVPSGKGRAEVRMLDRRGAAVPLLKLDVVFRLAPAQVPATKAIVVRRNGMPFAFEVDQMVGQQEVVVRPLEDPLVRRPGIVGSTDLGDGQPTLVLDLISLSGALSRRRTDVRA
jgi:two-component system chemotaxis sensor kinase CheA